MFRRRSRVPLNGPTKHLVPWVIRPWKERILCQVQQTRSVSMWALFAIAQDGLVDYVRFYALTFVTHVSSVMSARHELINILRHPSQSNIAYRSRCHNDKNQRCHGGPRQLHVRLVLLVVLGIMLKNTNVCTYMCVTHRSFQRTAC